MSGQSLASVLGANATQTSSTVTISKADLASVGLTASGANDGEAIFAAIVLLAKQYLTSSNQVAIPAIQTIINDVAQPSYVTRNGQLYKRDSMTIAFDKATTNPVLDPDDY
ncbi:hypothetical protein [Nostoc punctiforme]|uniref:Uncharacterized protein n=1 Tax=Nostoc punctiforme (strain ATCC 29133 / PCC 73102) TaxID=63737 RepID=B2J1I0_NOSP7|nr:hypothetical protein [Nostoc punctiforme]ACC80341.1 hypothetical protein Npun_F1669 [Nostoc punctiforme PCC 73102]